MAFHEPEEQFDPPTFPVKLGHLKGRRIQKVCDDPKIVTVGRKVNDPDGQTLPSQVHNPIGADVAPAVVLGERPALCRGLEVAGVLRRATKKAPQSMKAEKKTMEEAVGDVQAIGLELFEEMAHGARDGAFAHRG